MAKIKYNQSLFLEKALLVHGNKYDYSDSFYLSTRKKIKIRCPIHGIFEQYPVDHLRGHGCNKCSIENRKILKKKDSNLFLSELLDLYGDRYSFDKVIYSGASKKIIVTCPTHGDFEIEANSFLKGHECPKCSYEKRANDNIEKHKSKFLSSSHNFKIIESSYNKATSSCIAICPNHGEFIVNKAYRITQGVAACPSCSVSNLEKEILEYVNSLGVKVIKSYRPSWMNGKELDLFFPDFGFAIEFNGSYWHSDRFKEKWYHFDKSKTCIDNNVLLLHIWEHYWDNDTKKEIYKSKIRHFLKMDNRVFARKCRIESLDKKDAIDFIKANHLEGFKIPYKDSRFIGLFFNEKLLMTAVYGKFYEQSTKTEKWKLQRIATLKDYTVVGGISKLSRFIKNDVGDFIFQVTLDTGGTIFKANISKKDVSLRYWWVKNNSSISRNNTQLSNLRKKIDWEKDDTEDSYMRKNHFLKVWDSGILEVKNGQI